MLLPPLINGSEALSTGTCLPGADDKVETGCAAASGQSGAQAGSRVAVSKPTRERLPGHSEGRWEIILGRSTTADNLVGRPFWVGLRASASSAACRRRKRRTGGGGSPGDPPARDQSSWWGPAG